MLKWKIKLYCLLNPYQSLYEHISAYVMIDYDMVYGTGKHWCTMIVMILKMDDFPPDEHCN